MSQGHAGVASIPRKNSSFMSAHARAFSDAPHLKAFGFGVSPRIAARCSRY